MAPYSAQDVAAELRRRLPGVGTKKLHKLLYYCQGHHLGALGEPMFSEDFQAWDRGPVVASLWRAERYDQAEPVSAAAFDQGTLNTIGYVISRYGAMTGADLEALTHNEQPWMVADARRRSGGSQVMAKAEIGAYFAHHQATDESDDDEDFAVDPAVTRAWLAGAKDRLRDPLSHDDRGAILGLTKQ
ncbi:Panacea domain-containing protein [Jatrophihabitans sp.]|uniref:Panacea domain-containing protein n=1 Tax=Jatrophihabitans sp. TaxID=1932789 RepID=UPI002CC49A92|nr:type II toxin-antitoxin system antitoxin SocA domain-containing protein [Jatrophihabitans sp.]